MEKIKARWEPGIFVGVKRKSNEIMVSRPEGIWAVRPVRRIRKEVRRGDDCVSWVKWAPWRRCKDAEDGDGRGSRGSTSGRGG